MIKDIAYGLLGAASLAGKKAKKAVDELVASGEISREEGEKVYGAIKEKLSSEGKEVEQYLEEQVKKIVDKLNLATKDELNALKKEIENLKN